jgi:hypothetical protein
LLGKSTAKSGAYPSLHLGSPDIGCESFRSKHLLDISPIDEDIGGEAIIVTFAARMLWKKYFVRISLVTPQVLWFAIPTVPDLLMV